MCASSTAGSQSCLSSGVESTAFHDSRPSECMGRSRISLKTSLDLCTTTFEGSGGDFHFGCSPESRFQLAELRSCLKCASALLRAEYQDCRRLQWCQMQAQLQRGTDLEPSDMEETRQRAT